MKTYSREQIQNLRQRYPTGSRVQLIELNGPYCKLEKGECGMLQHIDDVGTFHVQWDNGSGIGLVPGEDRFNLLPPTISTVKMYMPMTIDYYVQDDWRDMEEECYTLSPEYAVEFEDIIHTAILDERMPHENERGLMYYYDRPDSINFKVKSYAFDVEVRDGLLWGVAECEIYGKLSDEELEALKDIIAGQASDGFGEGFEQRKLNTYDGSIYAHLWNSDDWHINTESELFGQKQDEGMVMR